MRWEPFKPTSRVRRRNPGPLLMVNPSGRYRRKAMPKRRRRRNVSYSDFASFSLDSSIPKKSRKSGAAKRKATIAAKHAARVRAGKKAARTRAARKAAKTRKRKGTKMAKRRPGRPKGRKTVRRRRRRRFLAKGRKRFNVPHPKSITIRVKNPRRRRRRNVRRVTRRTYRRRNPRKYRHRIARRFPRRFTVRRPRYVSVRTRNRRRRRRNPSSYIRTRNPAIMDMLVPIALGVAGFLGASYLITKLPEGMAKSLMVGKDKTTNIAPIVIPIGLAALGMLVLAPKLPKYSKFIYGASLGLAIAGGVQGAKLMLKDSKWAKEAGILSGYTTIPMAGYVRSLNGYIHRPLGQIERPQLSAGGGKAYGVGAPQESRGYDKFTWGGIYGQSSWES